MAMEARGTKLSKRDKEWLDGFKAIKEAGRLGGVGAKNLKEMDLKDVATKQNELNQKLTDILRKQTELNQMN
jgi:hypothetical protein